MLRLWGAFARCRRTGGYGRWRYAHVEFIIMVALRYFVFLTFGLAVYGILAVWRSRQEDAFNFWFSGQMSRFYDPEKAKPLFVALNPMPIWSLFDRQWFENIRNPEIADVVKVASRSDR